MADTRFHFQIEGKDYSLPREITAGALRAASNSDRDQVGQVFMMVEQCADPATLAALDTLPVSEFNRIIGKEWLRGMSAGESSSSPS